MRKQLIYIFRFLFPLMFILQLGAINLFSHVHVVNGVTIVHSHPLSDSAHEHTTTEYQFIHSISDIDTIETIFYADCLDFSAQHLYTLNFPKTAGHTPSDNLRGSSLRAPPCA